ncbi:MAG: hypothetical protein UH081_07085 [Clostridia bacterium]|nr:hypothetical protein [Clostridia bacterium]
MKKYDEPSMKIQLFDKERVVNASFVDAFVDENGNLKNQNTVEVTFADIIAYND